MQFVFTPLLTSTPNGASRSVERFGLTGILAYAALALPLAFALLALASATLSVRTNFVYLQFMPEHSCCLLTMPFTCATISAKED